MKLMKNRFVKQTIAIFTAFGLVISGMGLVTLAQEVKGNKDETIYFDLNANGRLTKAIVVNAFDMENQSDNQELIDYGQYTDVINLSTLDQTSIDADRVSISIGQSGMGIPERLYYQGTLKDPVNPWVIDIHYFLDGMEVSPEALSGAKGAFELRVDVKPNPISLKRFADRYTLQAVVVLDTQVASHIEVEGATIVTVGSNKQIAMTVLPKQAQSCTIKADIHDFKMVGISMTGTELSLGLDIDTIAITDGVTEMVNGSNELVKGTRQLLEGMEESASAVQSLNTGMSKIVSSGSELTSGNDQIGNGIEQLKSASEAITGGIDGLGQQFASVSEDSVAIASLATQLSQSEDQSIQALAKAYLGQQMLIDGSKGALGELLSGSQALTTGLDQLSTAHSGYTDGFQSYLVGIDNFSAALSRFNTSFSEVPSSVDQLLEGQIALNNGLIEARNQLTEMLDQLPIPDDEDGAAINSFVDDRNTPNSVQFIMKTPSIDYEIAKDIQPIKEEKKGFWDRVKALF